MRSDRNEGVEQLVLKNGKEEEKLGEIKGVIGYDWRRNESSPCIGRTMKIYLRGSINESIKFLAFFREMQWLKR